MCKHNLFKSVKQTNKPEAKESGRPKQQENIKTGNPAAST